MLERPELPCAPEARLHFVEREHDLVLVAPRAEFLHKLHRREVRPDALIRLHDHACRRLRREPARLHRGGRIDDLSLTQYRETVDPKSPPVVLLRVKVMDLPKYASNHGALYRRLLELNASDLLHGSYGIQDDTVVLTEALELSHLDYEEFLASYESITLALASNIRELATFREAR